MTKENGTDLTKENGTEQSETAIRTARRRLLKQLLRASIYIPPVLMALSIEQTPAQFPSPPPPP